MTMDPSIAILKGRMAEALVEAVFKRAHYTVARVGRESSVPALVRRGRAEFMPDFVVWRTLDEPSLGHHSYRLLAIEVKYRADLEAYLRQDSPSRSSEIAQQWPELYEVIVTDSPASGRSCFQVLNVSQLASGTTPAPQDLHTVPGLDIYRKTVEEYEGLVREIFPILGSRRASEEARKPGAWMPGRRHRAAAGHLHPLADAHRYRPLPVREQRPGDSE
ncbi:MAG TPA: hypothetical protein VFE48_00625 [Methylomirabilota bacterium]|nr:hypothetical protein [Methylomirabilota bacterium]